MYSRWWLMLLAGLALTLCVVAAACARLKPERKDARDGMVPVPSGVLDRGDVSGAGYRDERPVRSIRLSGFFMDRTEVNWGLWNQVAAWARLRGYGFDDPYDGHPGRGSDHPVCNVSWFDAVKWCNARSEWAGQTPVYYTDERHTEVFRRGQPELTAGCVRWEAAGFRLPTEAEWEWAARGGLEGHHYPWPSPGPDFAVWMDVRKANYWQSGDPWESESECATWPATAGGGEGLELAGVNGYGLLNMAGNVAEWCWDWYLDTWYEMPESAAADTKGPTRGYGRVLRGGSWISNPKYCRVAARYMSAPDYRCHCYGLRCVIQLRSGRLRP